jgi:hypothetical protein
MKKQSTFNSSLSNKRETNQKTKLMNMPKWALLLSMFIIFAFVAKSQNLTLISPNGGETWMYGTTQTIAWQLDGGFEDLYFEYLADDGTYWNYLGYVSAYDSITSITFTNYLYANDSAKIRISLYDDPDVFDETDGYLTILDNPIYFYSPSNGQRIYGGHDFTLSWYNYSFDTTDVSYTMDGGATWNLIESSYTGNYLEWTTPVVVSDQCMIKVANANDPSDYGLSTTFSIIETPTASIISPNGGEVWNYGDTETVSWSGTNLPTYLYLQYSTDGGQDWGYLGYGYGDETGGSTQVYVPFEPSTNTLVRLVDPNYDIILDESDQPFTIYVPPVIMYSPYEGQQFYIKDRTWISWLTSGISEVNIDLSIDGGTTWTSIDQNIDADQGWYQWEISGSPSTNCKIRVSDASDATKFGISDEFTLLATPIITLDNPIGGEIWNTNVLHTISWTYNNPDAYYVYIDYSNDNGQNWNYLGYSINENDQGSIEWQTPQFESDSYLIRVRDSYLDFVSDTSSIFAIRTFPETPICIVTVDSITNNNMIIWDKPIDDLISSFIVYKESDIMNTYVPIGTIAYDSNSIFIDTNSNPAVKSYRYRLGFSDSEGNEYPMGLMHQSIHLAINKGVGDSWNLIWTKYIGFDVSSYNIYRSANGSNYELISTISSSFHSYTDVNAPNGNVFYYIEVINDIGCNVPGRNISRSISNIATNNILGIEDSQINIEAKLYPNPANNMVNLKLGSSEQSYKIQMIDLTGKVILNENIVNPKVSQTLKLNTETLHEGFYFLKISSGNNTIAKKLIVRH